MAIDFPTSPSDGQTFNTDNVYYVYSDTKGVWLVNNTNVTISSTNVSEGTNLYYRDDRVYANISPLLYSDSDAYANISASDLVYTDADAYANISPLLYTDEDTYANISPLLYSDADAYANISISDLVYTDADAYANINPIITALPSQEQTYTAKQTFTGSATNVSVEIKNLVEDGTISATASTGTINFDALTQSVLYYTTNASGNFVLNIRGSSSTSLSSLLDVGDSITVVFLATNGATAYYMTGVQVDGSSVTPKWQGGSAPTEGNPSSIDVYSITVIKTAATPTYTVLASQTQFA